MKALIIGATGATGKNLLTLLLNDDTVKQVSVFVRRDIHLTHHKLSVHIIDFDRPEQWSSLVTGDVLFSCLGTTLKAAGSKTEQWKIDYEYQFKFAEVARRNGIQTYVLVSASNASSDSRIFYSKMKGQLDDAVKQLNFDRLIIFRPPLLLREGSDRSMEILAAKIIVFLNTFGVLKSQKPLSTEALAKAMIASVKTFKNGHYILEGQEIGK